MSEEKARSVPAVCLMTGSLSPLSLEPRPGTRLPPHSLSGGRDNPLLDFREEVYHTFANLVLRSRYVE